MADVQDLIAQAQALGRALAAHPTVRAYYEAQRAVRADASARQLLTDYQAHLARLHELESAMKPIEVADKHKLKDFERQMAGHDALKTLSRAQADYAALMAQVNGAIDGPLNELARPERPA